LPPRAVKVNAWERRWKALRRPVGRLPGLRKTLNVRVRRERWRVLAGESPAEAIGDAAS
jgi:hypothetical protein